jgi:hypothetical protein
MQLPKPFDGYVEQPGPCHGTSLIHFQRNRYSVPCEWVNSVVSLRAYPEFLRGGQRAWREGRWICRAAFERDQTFYDWQHYISLIERKPGALRNGAPFKTMPEPLQELQRQLLKNPGGDRVMAQVLSCRAIARIGFSIGGHTDCFAGGACQRRARPQHPGPSQGPVQTLD